jgi:hypothetical protein
MIRYLFFFSGIMFFLHKIEVDINLYLFFGAMTIFVTIDLIRFNKENKS